MKFNFKKISAVLTSGLMIGMTMGVAAAASFPAPYVTGGSASGTAIVYGTGTGADDAGAYGSIQSYLAGKESGGTSTGEKVLLDKSNDHLNLGDAMNAVHTSINKDELPVLLANGVYTADDSDTFKYTQKITLGSTTATHFQDSDYEDIIGASEKTPVIGFKITDDTMVLNYTLDFTSAAESDIVDSDLDDFKGSTIRLLGKDYYVSDFDVNTTAVNFGKVTLLDTANTGTVGEGETITVDVEGVNYEVSISTLTTTKARLIVNGVTTNELLEGGSQKLAGGAYLGIKDIFQRDVTGVVGKVEFSIGTGKLEITSDADIVLNDATIAGVQGTFRMGTASSSTTAKIDKIYITWTANNDLFLTEESELVMPGFDSIKLGMDDFVRPEEEKIVIQKDGDKSIELVMPLKSGDARINILHAEAGGAFDAIGKSTTERLATSNNQSLIYRYEYENAKYHKYFIATYNNTKDSETYLLSATITEDLEMGNKTTITNVYDTTQTCEEITAGNDCNFGSMYLTINAVGKNTTDRWVEFKGQSDVNFHTAFTNGGLMVYLPYTVNSSSAIAATDYGAINVSHAMEGSINSREVWNNTGVGGHGNDTFWIYLDGEDKEDTIAAGDIFNFTIDDTSTNLQVSQVNGAGSGGDAITGIASAGSEVGDSTAIYEAYIIDDVAPRILHYTKPDENWAEVYYPTGASETYANVYVAESGAASSSEFGGVVLMDTESWKSNNAIIVGGSCINKAAAEMLGVAENTCEGDFTAATGVASGQYLIESFAQGDKVALVVAGYEKADTAAGAAKLAASPSEIDTTAGKKYIAEVGQVGTLVLAEA